MNSIAAQSATGSSAATTQPSSSSGSGGFNGLTQADFIKLLTAQLQNQNPTSPTNPQDLANEFAELSTVSGINALNQKVTSIQSGAGAAQIGQAATLIGKTVAVSGGNTITADSSGKVTGAFKLSSSATGAVVSVIDPATGKTVHRIDMSNLPSGLNSFQWSGGAPNTSYHFQVSALSGSNPVSATTYSSGAISSVNLTSGTPTLSMTGASGPVDLSQVAGIIGG